MKKIFKLMAMAVVAMAATTFTACNADEDFDMMPQPNEVASETRAATTVFDNSASEGVLVLQ